MNAKASTFGVVVAGGRSVRFGGEKAAALLAGRPLLQWATARLSACCALVAVNARPGTEAEALARSAGFHVLHDEPGDAAGPLAGVKVGLSWGQSQGATRIAVSSCDSPCLPDALFPALIAASMAAESGAAFAVTSEGRQPLCAVWPVAALPEVTAALRDGAHPPTWRLLESIGAKAVEFSPPEAFANVNTREDLEVLARRFHQPRHQPRHQR